MCCSSMLCKSWTPIKRIEHVLEEVYQNLIIKKLVELFHCKKVVNKYLIPDMKYINNFFFISLENITTLISY